MTQPMIVKPTRPQVLAGITVKIVTGCGSMYVQLNWYRGRLFEIFATLGHSGGCAGSEMEALTRSVTLGLKCGVPVAEYIKQFRGIRCPTPVMFPKDQQVESCPDGIAKVLLQYSSMPIDKVVEMIVKAITEGDGEPEPTREDEEAREAAERMEKLRQEREDDGL